MDNREDRTRHRQESAARSRRDSSDPIVQPADYSGQGQKDNSKTSRVSRVAPTPALPGSQTLVPGRSAVMGTNTFMGDGGSVPAGPSLSDNVRSTLRFKWTIVLIFVLLAVPAIAAIWTQVTPKYQAKAEIRIRPVIPHLVFPTEDTGLLPLYDSFVNTQVAIIKGPEVLRRVLERPEVRATRWWANPRPSLMQRFRNERPTRIVRLMEDIQVRPSRRTEITNVLMHLANAEDARIIVQAVVEEYERYAQDQSNKDRDAHYRQLSNQYKKLDEDVKYWEGKCFALEEELGAGDPDRLLSSKSTALDEGQAALDAINQDIFKLEKQIEEAGGADANDIVVAGTVQTMSQPKYYTDAEWNRLDSAVKSARHAIITSPLKPSHPGMDTLEKDLAFAEGLLRERQERLDEQWLLTGSLTALTPDANNLTPEQMLEYSQSQLKILTGQAKRMEEELTEKRQEYTRLFAKSQELKRATASLQHQRGLFDAVRARKDAKDMERSILGRVSIQAPAMASYAPHNDRRVLYTGIVLAICLILVSGTVCIRRRPIDKMSQSK